MDFILLLGQSLMDRLAMWNVIVGIILIVIGVVLYAFSKRFTMIKRHTDDVPPTDTMVWTLRLIGFCFLIAGLVIMIIQ